MDYMHFTILLSGYMASSRGNRWDQRGIRAHHSPFNRCESLSWSACLPPSAHPAACPLHAWHLSSLLALHKYCILKKVPWQQLLTSRCSWLPTFTAGQGTLATALSQLTLNFND